MSVATAPRGGALRVTEYNLLAARRFWRPLVIGGVVMPVLTAASLGVGLGHVVHSSRLGASYLDFVAPALLAAAALMSAAGEAMYPVMAGFKWQRHFHGMAATPLSPRQICDGVLVWMTLRIAVTSALYLAILAAFGGVPRAAAVLAVPTVTFTAIAFAAPVLALSASIEAESQAFNVMQRFVIMPMFLFSGTFYPLSQLPAWGRGLAWVSPLWHGTEVARACSLGHLSATAIVGHLAYLAVWLGVGVALARRRFAWRIAR
jgi:lipooligosaccharide transport system permease protein